MWERRPLCSSRLDSEIRILRPLITIQLGDDVVEIAAARWSVEHDYFDAKSSSRSRRLELLREQLLRENRRSAGTFSHPLVSRLSVADRWPDSQPDEDMDQEMARSICSAFGLIPHDADSKRPAATSESEDDSIVLTQQTTLAFCRTADGSGFRNFSNSAFRKTDASSEVPQGCRAMAWT